MQAQTVGDGDFGPVDERVGGFIFGGIQRWFPSSREGGGPARPPRPTACRGKETDTSHIGLARTIIEIGAGKSIILVGLRGEVGPQGGIPRGEIES